VVLEEWRLGLCITLGAIAVSGVCSALATSKVLSIVAILPPKYTGAVMSGNGFAGIITLIIYIISYFTVDIKTFEGANLSTLIFFSVGSTISVLCVIAVIVFDKLKFVQYYKTFNNSSPNKEYKPLLDKTVAEQKAEEKNDFSKLGVFKVIWKQSLNVFITFFITLSLFPGQISIITPQENSIIPADLMGSILIGVFQIFDCIGRTLPSFKTILFNPRNLIIPTLIRTAFYPLIIILAFPSYKYPMLHSDGLAFLIVAIFALTNGYLGTLSMIFGPSTVELTDYEKPMAGIIMSFSLGMGILLGQHVGFLLKFLLYTAFQ